MQNKMYDEVKRFAGDRDTWRRRYTNLLTQKIAHDDDELYIQ